MDTITQRPACVTIKDDPRGKYVIVYQIRTRKNCQYYCTISCQGKQGVTCPHFRWAGVVGDGEEFHTVVGCAA